MRIARVALSFFSIGFLAGSFEQAAGLGVAERRGQVPVLAVELPALATPAAIELAAPSLSGHFLAKPDSRPARTSASSSARTGPLIEAGDATVAEWAAAWDHVRYIKAEPVALQPPDGLTPPPLPDGLVAPEPRLARRPPDFILPFEKGRVTSLFNQGRRHPAIDLAGPLGTPVYATTRKQRVVFAGRRGGYGNLVITADPQGRQHYYGHLQRILVRTGAVLEQGETLGLLGSTGRSTGPHVHYEVRTSQGRHLDPAKLLFAGLGVRRGYAWHMPRPDGTGTRMAQRGAKQGG